MEGEVGNSQTSSPMKSARRSYTQRMAGLTASDAKVSVEKDNRPPLYVPTKREPVVGS